jgi:DNA-binding MarR family transcriptional regulator
MVALVEQQTDGPERPSELHADLGWALRTISIAFRASAIDAVRHLPGGPRGYLVLTALSTGDATSQLALAQSLSIDKTQMTYLLDELQSAELVERALSPGDRRVRLVKSTDAGRAALTEARRATRDAERDVLSELTEAEQATLVGLLSRAAVALSSGVAEGMTK